MASHYSWAKGRGKKMSTSPGQASAFGRQKLGSALTSSRFCRTFPEWWRAERLSIESIVSFMHSDFEREMDKKMEMLNTGNLFRLLPFTLMTNTTCCPFFFLVLTVSKPVVCKQHFVHYTCSIFKLLSVVNLAADKHEWLTHFITSLTRFLKVVFECKNEWMTQSFTEKEQCLKYCVHFIFHMQFFFSFNITSLYNV